MLCPLCIYLVQVGSIPAEERMRIKTIIDAGDRTAISTDMFDEVQKLVFKEMFYNTFQRFIDTPAYVRMHHDIKNAYNKVGSNLKNWAGADDHRYAWRYGMALSLIRSRVSVYIGCHVILHSVPLYSSRGVILTSTRAQHITWGGASRVWAALNTAGEIGTRPIVR